MSRRTVNVDLNRVEGDLAIEIDLEDDRVVDARCVGTLYRGLEQIMIGRAAFDALVIAPRVCGICNTAHLYAAALALEHAWQIEVPPLATLVRELGLMTEAVQSDLRQSFLFFTPDFVHARYASHPLADAMQEAFAPFAGKFHLETIAQTRKLIEILALYAGQWPHSSWIVPGGITGRPDDTKRMGAEAVLDGVTRWFESEVLGGSLASWLALRSAAELAAWMEARPASALGLLTQMARSVGLDEAGRSRAAHLSYGSGLLATEWQPPYATRPCRLRAGTLADAGGTVEDLDPDAIGEQIRHAWYADDAAARHSTITVTVPNYPGTAEKYSWIKAPRYRDRVMQTGALSELAVAGEPLTVALLASGGDNVWLRQFARLRRVGVHLAQMRQQLQDIHAQQGQAFINHVRPDHAADGDGYGLLQAARGALGHWVSLRGGRIAGYQIISPTTWNASPRDDAGRPGHWEESLIGTVVRDPDDPLEVGHIIRAHDPCLVCAVHVTEVGRTRRRHGRP